MTTMKMRYVAIVVFIFFASRVASNCLLLAFQHLQDEYEEEVVEEDVSELLFR